MHNLQHPSTLRRRLGISFLIAGALHVALILALVVIRFSDADFSPASIIAPDSTLAPLPSLAARSELPGSRRSDGNVSRAGTASSPFAINSPALPPPPISNSRHDDSPQNGLERTAEGTPLSNRFTATQETTYVRGKRLHIPPGTRLHADMDAADSAWQGERARRANTEQGRMQQNLAFTPGDIEPTERQKLNRQRDLHPGTPSDIMPSFPRAGISVTFDTRTLLGLDEDVSATFGYKLLRTSHVQIVIYTAKGDPISKLFDGMQAQGTHSMTWDAHDQNGARVPPGDYVVEIVINNEQRITKRIVVT